MTQSACDTRCDEQNCFLCDPSRDLVFFTCDDFFALAGLGPVVDGYSVLAARPHLKSMADMPSQLAQKRDALVHVLRDRLSRKYGGCLITEHGRMAVCAEDDNDHEAHCFHAHFLIFPGVHDVTEMASSYFGKVKEFNELGIALSHAAQCEEYVLISPTPKCFRIFSAPLNIPRQLTRFLVAHHANVLHLANWRDQPNRERAEAIADNLRSLFATELCHVGPSTNG
jgi:hypothetical protein